MYTDKSIPIIKHTKGAIFMKLLKKTLAILLCLIMAVGIMPLSAVARDDDDVVKVDHVTVKTDSIFKVGEALPEDFKADYTDHLFKLEDVDWSCTEVYNEWDYKSLGAFSYAGDTFEKGRGYELVLTFYSDQKEVDVKKFTLKTGDNTYTSYGTSSGVALRQSNVLYYHQPYTLAYFYIPFTELGHKVTTYDELQSALLKSEDYVITLGKDITKEIGLGKTEESEAAQLTVNGKKWLNLNGKKLKVVDHSDVTSDKDESLRSYRTLFTVSEGAELIVDDTRGKGEIKYDAHFISPNFFAIVYDEAYYFSVPERNMFNVRGKLTVNGGKFDAGGAKEQYLADEACNAYQIAAGYICKTEGSGQATFNGGEFIGHTFSEKIEQYYRVVMPGPQSDKFMEFNGGPYYVLSGNITINGGDFINEGVGNFVDKENSSKLRIINGSFDVKTHSKLRLPIKDNLDNYCTDWEVAAFNIPEGSWNSNDSLFLKDGKLCFNPAKDFLDDYAEDARIDIFKIDFYRANPGLSGKNIIAEVNYAIGTEEFTVVGQTSTTYTNFLYSAKLPPQYLIDKGYVLNIRGTLFDPSGKQLFMEPEDDSYVTLYPEDYCTTPGTYTYKVTFVLMDKDGKLCGVKPYTVLINAVTPCETHDYYEISNTATCTWRGTKTEVCTKCGNVNTDTTGALGHTYEEYSDPWSSDSMYHWKYCYRCNKTVDKGVHGYRAGESVCVTCGLDNSCDYGNAMDLERNETHHWWACETHAPEDACPNDHKLEYGAHEACSYEDLEGSTLDGVTNTLYNCGEGYVCDGCGHYFGETGNHTWVLASRTEPTCGADGVEWYRCSNSGKIDPKGNRVACVNKKVTLPATGEHNYVLKSDTATCQADGKATYKCSGCGDTKTVDSQKTGHIYGLVSDTATCTSSGEATYKCNTCSASYKEVSPAKGHNHIEDSYVAPTTEAEGKITYKCTDCGNVKTETLEKLSVIREPKTKSINCKDGVLIRPNFAVIPEGATVEWTADNSCFNWSVDAEGNVKAISNSSGDTTFTAKVKLEDGTYLTDMYGNEVVDQTTVKSNAGFFQKIIGFFKGLFGLTKIHE